VSYIHHGTVNGLFTMQVRHNHVVYKACQQVAAHSARFCSPDLPSLDNDELFAADRNLFAAAGLVASEIWPIPFHVQCMGRRPINIPSQT
jgi:hypothetical protein